MTNQFKVNIFLAISVITVILVFPVQASAQPIYSIDTHEKVVALTFDDGPSPTATLKIAEILSAANVPATFFSIGSNIVRYPQVTKALAADGFTIGNHSWDHPVHFARLPTLDQITELAKTNHIISTVARQEPKYFRPPHGSWSSNQMIVAKSQGLTTTLWSVDPGDWQTNDAKTIADIVESRVRPGAVIVLHDNIEDGATAATFSDRAGTIEALPMIIANLQSRGYRFVSLDELLSTGTLHVPPKRWFGPDLPPKVRSGLTLGTGWLENGKATWLTPWPALSAACPPLHGLDRGSA